MKIFRSALLSLVVLVLFNALALNSFASGVSDVSDEKFLSENASYDYVITSYDITANVSEDNVLSVTEKINVFFNSPRHGIYRVIQTKGNVARSDGSDVNYSAKINSLKASEEFDTSSSGGEYTIKLGSADETITGAHSYEISYNYVIGEDKLKGADELYYNIIGSQWSAPINNLTFKFTMPKDFDSSKIGFSTGSYGTEGTNKVKFSVDGKTISGYCKSVIEPETALTIRLTLPDKYFTFNYALYYTKVALIAFFPFAALLFVAIMFLIFGRDSKPVQTVEFYPPDGINSAQANLWYHGTADNDGIISLLIYLADKGYIGIRQSSGNKKYFTIEKLKDYDGTDQNEREFISGLFPNCEKVTSTANLKNHFYLTVNSIKGDLNSKKSRSEIFNSKTIAIKKAAYIVIALCAAIGAFFIHIADGGTFDFEVPILISIGAGLIFSAAALILNKFMLQRTQKGKEYLGKLRGFRQFLESAEKDKLEALVKENPQYFYNILPYTYALGVSDVWMKKFKSIAMEPPRWYYTDSRDMVFDYIIFSSFMNNAMNSASSNMTSQPQSSGSSSGGGGFIGGGGGFAGGGFGGGGGGSW